MFKRKNLISSILGAMSMSMYTETLLDLSSNRVRATSELFTKPPTKAKFKQNQRKQRKASARKKSK